MDLYDATNRKIILAGCFTLLSACTLTQPEIPLEAFNKAEEVLGEWGSAAASAPILSESNEEFKFDLDKDADDFYKNAKEEVNAGISQHTQTITSLLLAGSAQLDPLNTSMFDSQMKDFNKASDANSLPKIEPTEQEKIQSKEMQSFLLEEAKANYDVCIATADSELIAAAELEDTDKKAALNSNALTRRNVCFTEYQARVSPSKEIVVVNHPGLPENNVPLLERIQKSPFQAKSVLSPDFHKKENSAFSEANALPDHQAIAQAVTNNFLKAIYENLSSDQGSDSFFGVSMVSVNPGWRTKEDYKAVINIRPRVVFNKASEPYTKTYLSNKSNNSIIRAYIATRYGVDCKIYDFKEECADQVALLKKLKQFVHTDYKKLRAKEFSLAVTAISPVAYGQTFDLKNKQLSQFNLSLMLAASLREAGAEQSAEIFADFSREQRKEFGSRNLRNHVNVFSHNNTMVGVEISPEFFASNYENNDPVEILQAQTFPMLFRFETREFNQLENIVAENCDEDKTTQDYCLLEPVIATRTTNRWMPINANYFDISWLPNEVTLTTEDLYNIRVDLDKFCDRPETRAKEAIETDKIKSDVFMQERCGEIHTKLFGETSFTSIPITAAQPTPKIGKPTIEHVYPQKVTLALDDKKQVKPLEKQFVMSGKNLKLFAKDGNIDLSSYITPMFGGQSVTKATLVGDSILANVKFTENKGPLIFKLANDKYNVNTGNSEQSIVQVTTESVSEKTKKEASVFTLTIDESGNKVILPIGATDLPREVSDLLQAIQKGDDSNALSQLANTCAVLIMKNPSKVFDLGACEKGK